MSQSIEAGTADVPGVGQIAYRVRKTNYVNGVVVLRVLDEARYVDGDRLVVSEDHRSRISEHLGLH